MSTLKWEIRYLGSLFFRALSLVFGEILTFHFAMDIKNKLNNTSNFVYILVICLFFLHLFFFVGFRLPFWPYPVLVLADHAFGFFPTSEKITYWGFSYHGRLFRFIAPIVVQVPTANFLGFFNMSLQRPAAPKGFLETSPYGLCFYFIFLLL